MYIMSKCIINEVHDTNLYVFVIDTKFTMNGGWQYKKNTKCT